MGNISEMFGVENKLIREEQERKTQQLIRGVEVDYLKTLTEANPTQCARHHVKECLILQGRTYYHGGLICIEAFIEYDKYT